MNLLLLTTPADTSYLPSMKPIIGIGHSTFVVDKVASTLAEVLIYCQKKNIQSVLTTQAGLIPKLMGENPEKYHTLDNFAGSIFKKSGIEFLILPPLATIHTVPYGKFLISRFITKITQPNRWHSSTEFSWEVATPANIEGLYNEFKSADFIALDIETVEENLAITCVGYCAVWLDNATGTIRTHAIVLPMDSEFMLTWVKKFNLLDAPKVAQTGKYDIAYLARYGAPVVGYYFDTAIMMHCWYSEMPKDLGFLNAFFVRDAIYWKHEGQVGFRDERYYLYNAHDTHNTANSMIAWLLEAPVWAKENFKKEMATIPVCHLAEMTGIKLDEGRRVEVRQHWLLEVEKEQGILNTILGADFNVNSHKQVTILRTVLGCEDIKSGDEANLKKASTRHPLNELVFNHVLNIRQNRKLVSTYLKDTGMALEGFNDASKKRILYSLNPYKTDTGRLASSEHPFWLGINIQNQPREEKDRIKEMYIADDGFLFGEADYEQAETRDTGYITGDTNLITAVEGDRDFHSVNASKFFGLAYEDIINPITGVVINKPVRDLSKRTNHGANYNMGAGVMLATMGEIAVVKAKKLLGLPIHFTPLIVCEYLLEQFAKTYPVVRYDYQEWIIATVRATHMLVAADGWTRYCFGKPWENKPDLNSYIAHCPQNLNARFLNEAWINVFNTIWIPHYMNFKLCAQIHDSILFQYRIGHEYLCDMVAKCMDISMEVVDIKGVSRILRVPVDVKKGGDRWSNTK